MIKHPLLAIETSCEQHLVKHRDQTHILGLSGGRDSVALLLLLHEKGHNIHACHLNHGLRGEAADQDAQFCQQLCSKLGVSFSLQTSNIPALAEAKKQSFELTARQERRTFFLQQAQQHKAASIILAQHADDQAETILFKLARGAGGLRGIKTIEKQEGIHWLRPLLHTRRKDISQYLNNKGQTWRDDQSNSDCQYSRNALRHQVIPAYSQAMGRDIIPIINRSTQVAQREQQALKQALLQLRDKYYDPQGRLYLPALQETGEELCKSILHSYMGEQGVQNISHEKVEESYELVQGGQKAVVNLGGGAYMRRRQKRLYVVKE